jgi:hypothetical protein
MAKPLYETGFNWSPGRGVLEYTEVYRGGLLVGLAGRGNGWGSERHSRALPTIGCIRLRLVDSDLDVHREIAWGRRVWDAGGADGLQVVPRKGAA